MNDNYPLAKFVAFSIIASLFGFWIIMLIGNINIGGSRVDYTAVFDDATGLLANDNVMIAGVPVGKVNNVEVMDGSLAKVQFQVDDDVRLGPDTTVDIRWRDAIGLRFLYLEPAGEGELEAGHVFPTEVTTAPAQISELLNGLTPIMEALDPDTANIVIQAFAEALVGREDEVRQLVCDGGELTSTLATRDAELRALLTNSADILDAYAAQEENLDGLVDALADVSVTLAARNDELIRAVSTLDDAQDELAGFVADNDDEIKLALDALDRVTAVTAVNRGRLERTIESFGVGFGAYHRISNIGQYFNVRGVGFSLDYNDIPGTSYRGAELPERRGGSGSSGSGGGITGLFGGSALAAQGGAG